MNTYIGVELPDEAGEIIVLEVGGKEAGGELGGIPDDEAGLCAAPGDDFVGGRIVNHVVGL